MIQMRTVTNVPCARLMRQSIQVHVYRSKYKRLKMMKTTSYMLNVFFDFNLAIPFTQKQELNYI